MIKNAFDWQGEPSVWLKDKKLKQVAAGHILGLNSRERIKLTEMKQVNVYSNAKLKGK
jgi:NAD(P)H-dependent FMN reductase